MILLGAMPTVEVKPVTKKLYRSRRHRVIGGVCGGLAEYLGTDPVAIRLVWLLLILFGGTGLLLYLLAWIIMPDERSVVYPARSAPQARPVEDPGPARQESSGGAESAREWSESPPSPASPVETSTADFGRRNRVAGAILVAVGAYFLIDQLVYFDLSAWWPVLLIIGGVALLFTGPRESMPETGPRRPEQTPPVPREKAAPREHFEEGEPTTDSGYEEEDAAEDEAGERHS